MPYAFAQYTVSCLTIFSLLHTSNIKQNDDDAKVAIDEGRGIMILGRPCRTEMVKANRKCSIPSSLKKSPH